MTDVLARLGPAFRAIRKEAGLTQAQLAARLGITSVHLSMVEAGRSRPSLALIVQLRGLLGRDPYLLAASDDPEARPT